MNYSIEAEQAVVGGLLVDPEKLAEVLELITYQDFYSVRCRHIFYAIHTLAAANYEIDALTVAESLTASGTIDEAGGYPFVVQLASDVSSTANLVQYAKLIGEKSLQRQLIKSCAEIVKATESGAHSTQELLAFASSQLEGLQGGLQGEPVETFRQLLKSRVMALDERKNGGAVKGLLTGFSVLDERFNGIDPGALWILAARPGMGKELTNSSPVLLSNGSFKPIGDIVVGDVVASVDGKESVVNGHYPQGVKPIYRVTFSDGRFVDAGLEHQWEVNHRKWSSARVMTTREIIEKIKLKDYKSRIYIPNHSADFGEDKGIVIHPYLMGVLIGNGGLSAGGVKFSSCQTHILEKIRPMLLGCDLLPCGNDYRISTKRGVENRLISELKKLGLYGLKSVEKFIPDIYLCSSKESRIELMRGLIDTDGTVEKTGSMTYSTSSEKLASDVVFLARGLGSFASFSSRIPKYSYLGEKKEGHRNYCVYISNEKYGDFVTVPHKKERIKKGKGARNLNVESIEYIGEEECSCISVSHPRSLYLTKDYIVTHNTTLALNLADKISRDGGEVLIFSMEMPKEQLVDKMICGSAKFSYAKFRAADIGEDEWNKVEAGVGLLIKKNIHIIDRAGMEISHAASIAKKYAKHGNLKLIIVDYLQLFKCKSASRFEEVSEVSRQLKIMAKNCNCVVLALSQLNRNCESRSDKRPNNSDLRESGQIEQDADIISFIYREDYYFPETNNKGVAEIITTKWRHGDSGTDGLASMLNESRFADLDFKYVRQQNAENKTTSRGYN